MSDVELSSVVDKLQKKYPYFINAVLEENGDIFVSFGKEFYPLTDEKHTFQKEFNLAKGKQNYSAILKAIQEAFEFVTRGSNKGEGE